MSDPTTNTSRAKIVFSAFVDWVGEAIVGLVPLIAFVIAKSFSIPESKFFLCPDWAITVASCKLADENITQEVCILTVVISGLALWGVFCDSKIKMSSVGKVLVILCVLSLLAGAIIYALFAAHMAKGADAFSYAMLFVALVSSFALRMEKVIAAVPK